MRLATVIAISICATGFVSDQARADDARYFMGTRHFVRGDGNIRICYPKEFRLKLQNNIITSQQGGSSCGPAPTVMGADGSFSGHCVFPYDVVDFTGKLSGHTITMHDKHVMKDNSATCEYDMQLEESAQ